MKFALLIITTLSSSACAKKGGSMAMNQQPSTLLEDLPLTSMGGGKGKGKGLGLDPSLLPSSEDSILPTSLDGPQRLLKGMGMRSYEVDYEGKKSTGMSGMGMSRDDDDDDLVSISSFVCLRSSI
jgi:hypothetical protein